MTTDRYQTYKAALRTLDRTVLTDITDDELAALRDCAEGLLLERDAGEAGSIRNDAARVLMELTGDGRWSRDMSERIFGLLAGCGPDTELSPEAAPALALRGH